MCYFLNWISQCNFITYKLIRQRNEENVNFIFVVGVFLLSLCLSLFQSLNLATNLPTFLAFGRVFFCWTRENKFLALSLQVNSIQVSQNIRWWMCNLISLSFARWWHWAVYSLTQWVFPGFLTRVFMCLFLLANFFFRFSSIISFYESRDNYITRMCWIFLLILLSGWIVFKISSRCVIIFANPRDGK